MGDDISTSAKAEDWLQEMLPYIKSVHMKDYAYDRGFVDLLTGDVNWPVIREHLRGMTYEGWLVAEIEVDPVNRISAIRQFSAAIDRFMNS